MIPYILAAVGGYLIGQSQKKDVMANGGNVVDEKLKYGQMIGGDGRYLIGESQKKGSVESPQMAKGGMVDKLYYHKTSGGAEYLMSSSVKGTDEGSFDSRYIVRIDGAKKYGGELHIRFSQGRLIKKIKLYHHKTSGGAEYLCSNNVKGTDEGSFDSKYIVRIDGAKTHGGELLINDDKKFEDGGMTDKKIEGLESALNNPNLSPKMKRQLKMKLNEMKAIKEGRYSDVSKYGKFDDGGMMNNSYFPFGNLSKRRNDLYDLVNAMEEDEYKNFCSEYELNPYEADEVNDFIHKCQSPGIIIEEIESGQYK